MGVGGGPPDQIQLGHLGKQQREAKGQLCKSLDGQAGEQAAGQAAG